MGNVLFFFIFVLELYYLHHITFYYCYYYYSIKFRVSTELSADTYVLRFLLKADLQHTTE